MITGIESFRRWFHGFEGQYIIIGGTACDLLMSGEGMTFRATKDIDLVLIVEAISNGDRSAAPRPVWNTSAAIRVSRRC